MIQDTNLTLLAKMLDASSMRHKVIASNIANVNTPGYERRIVTFREQLAGAIRDGSPEKIRALAPTVIKSTDPVSSDGNNVAMEREMADLMTNTLFYKTCAQLLSARLAGYRAAITGETRTS